MKACKTCPFRPGAKASEMPGGFDVAWAETLRESCTESGRLDVKLATCHHKVRDVESLCAGFVNDQVRRGIPNLQLRLAAMTGQTKLPRSADPSLLSYEAMIEQMREGASR